MIDKNYQRDQARRKAVLGSVVVGRCEPSASVAPPARSATPTLPQRAHAFQEERRGSNATFYAPTVIEIGDVAVHARPSDSCRCSLRVRP